MKEIPRKVLICVMKASLCEKLPVLYSNRKPRGKSRSSFTPGPVPIPPPHSPGRRGGVFNHVENLEPVIHPVQHPSLSVGEVVESR